MKLFFLLFLFIVFDASAAISPSKKIIYYSNAFGGPFEALELCEAKNFPSGADYIKGECSTYNGVVACEALNKNTHVRVSLYSCSPNEIYVCPDGTLSSKGGVCESKCPPADTPEQHYPYSAGHSYICKGGCVVEISNAIIEIDPVPQLGIPGSKLRQG